MRIEGTNRATHAALRSAQRTSGGGSFQLDESDSGGRTAPLAQPATATGIEALIALQAVDDPLLSRRKAVRRGSALLDALAAAQADLLTGDVADGRLNLLMALVSQAREQTDPGLAGLIDDIELRVRVELAKRGRFPA